MKGVVSTLKLKIYQIGKNIEFIKDSKVSDDEDERKDRIISNLEKDKLDHEKAIEIIEKIE